MANHEIMKEWFRLANQDYNIAVNSKNTMHPLPVESICYHAQQAVEKSLKIILICNNQRIPKTHDIQLLKRLCNEIVPDIISFTDETADLLTEFAASRYPDNQYPLTEDLIPFALTQAEIALNIIIDHIPELISEHKDEH